MSDNHMPSHNPLKKYFRQPKIYISLPSQGKFYPDGSIEMTENGELPVYSMTAKDEMIIKTPDALLNGSSTVEVIQSCIPNIKNAWMIPSIDVDAILIAIRIATYGESMDLDVKTPVTGDEKSFSVDLRGLLDRLIFSSFDDTVIVNDMTIKIRPLTYKEFTESSLKTFEEQRLFKTINDNSIPDNEKLAAFSQSFRKLTDLTVGTMEKSIVSITFDGETVSNFDHIKEFIDNADKHIFKSIIDHIDSQRNNFKIKPFVVDATPDEVEKGVPETYEVPITFDSSNFFG